VSEWLCRFPPCFFVAVRCRRIFQSDVFLSDISLKATYKHDLYLPKTTVNWQSADAKAQFICLFYQEKMNPTLAFELITKA
jgi:hypothetical protein